MAHMCAHMPTLAWGRDSYILFRALWLKFHEFGSYWTLLYVYYGNLMHLSLGAGGGVILSIFRSEPKVACVSIETMDEPDIMARTGFDSSSVLMLSQLWDCSCFSCWLMLVSRLAEIWLCWSIFASLLSVGTLWWL